MTRFKPVWQLSTSDVRDGGAEDQSSAGAQARRGPFQPDAFMPSQHFDRIRRRTSPEQRLLIAMLADAVDCFQKHSLRGARMGRREGYEAELWLMSDDRIWPFSFENVCDILEIEVEQFRKGLRSWRERQTRGSRPQRAAESEPGRRDERAA